MWKDRKVFQALAMVVQFGLNMIVPILICTLLGVWLGKKFDMPWITVPLFIVGALAGFTSIYRLAKKFCGREGEENSRTKKIK